MVADSTMRIRIVPELDRSAFFRVSATLGAGVMAATIAGAGIGLVAVSLAGRLRRRSR